MIELLIQIQQFLQQSMKPFVAVVAMINGMIGGLILVLPILAVQGGTLLSFLVILITGFFSFYSCYLCVIHLGNHEDLDKALVYHFGGSKFIKISYDVLVSVNLLLLLLLYFELIVQQWQGFFGTQLAIPLCNAAALVGLVFLLNYLHLGAELLGYGIISIIGYCIFLIWMLATAPSGNNKIPLIGTGAVNLAASMGQAFAIQTFFIPVLRELPDTKNYPKYTLYAYLVGMIVYMYIAFAGGFGIVNRKQFVFPLQTIENYFPDGEWEVGILEGLYLVHLYSAFGEFLLVAKKRFFGIFNMRQSKPKQLLNIPQIILTLVVVGTCLGIYFGNVCIQNLIEINGAIIGFFFIYLIPALMHFYCLYLPQKYKAKPIQAQTDQNSHETKVDPTKTISIKEIRLEMTPREELIGEKQEKFSDIEELERNITKKSVFNNLQKQNPDESTLQKPPQDGQEIEEPKDLSCPCSKPKGALMVIDIISLVGMVGLGAFIMVDGFITVIQSVASNQGC